MAVVVAVVDYLMQLVAGDATVAAAEDYWVPLPRAVVAADEMLAADAVVSLMPLLAVVVVVVKMLVVVAVGFSMPSLLEVVSLQEVEVEEDCLMQLRLVVEAGVVMEVAEVVLWLRLQHEEAVVIEEVIRGVNNICFSVCFYVTSICAASDLD